MRHHYRCYPTSQVRQSLANLPPVELGFAASTLLPLGRFLRFEPQPSHSLFSPVEVSGFVGSVGYPKPCNNGSKDTGKPFNQKQQSPVCNEHMVSSLCDQPCKTTGKRSCEWRSRYKQPCPEGQLIPFEKEREQEWNTRGESSFCNAKQGTQNHHDDERSRHGLQGSDETP